MFIEMVLSSKASKILSHMRERHDQEGTNA